MATTLTTSYKQIFSFKASTYTTVKVFAKATQNTSANTSTISMYATLTGTGNSGSFSSGTLKYTLDGQTQSYSLGSTSYGGKTITYNTFTKTRSHASDGTYTNKTISVSISTKGSPNGSGSGTINCATIPRQNSITSVSEADIGSNINIVIGNNSSSFKNTVTWACNGLSGTVVATNGTTLDKVASGTYTWQIPTSILATIPNSQEATITLTNKTYSGSTQIGSNTTATLKAKVPNSSRPTLSLVSKVETDESVISALPSSTTNFTKPIINLSKPSFTFTATALDGATLNWLYLTTGSNTKAIQLSGTTQTITYTFENPMTNPIVTFAIYDSRGLTTGTPYTFDGTSQQFVYTNPIFKTVVIKRPNVTQSTVRAEITGVYTPKQLNGSTDNKIWVGFDSREVDGSYSGNIEWYESGVSSNITLDTTNGTWSFNGNLVKTAAYDKSYYFKVYLKDSVTGQQEFVYMLAKSVPTMSLGENDMQVNGDLFVSGTAQIQDGLYCRPTGQADTPVGNSMLVIKRVTYSEAPNNGVVLEFGNSKSWAGQLFIGDNSYQGIYYNGWSDGVRGSWIRLASQNDLAKNMITMQLTDSQSFSNSYAKLNLSARTIIGTKLSVSSNQVKIGSGVNHIKVSGTLSYNKGSAGYKYMRITKNFNTSSVDTTTITMQASNEPNAGTTQITATEIICNVTEGDLIGMWVYGASGDSARPTLSGNMLQTYMTIEVID